MMYVVYAVTAIALVAATWLLAKKRFVFALKHDAAVIKRLKIDLDLSQCAVENQHYQIEELVQEVKFLKLVSR